MNPIRNPDDNSKFLPTMIKHFSSNSSQDRQQGYDRFNKRYQDFKNKQILAGLQKRHNKFIPIQPKSELRLSDEEPTDLNATESLQDVVKVRPQTKQRVRPKVKNGGPRSWFDDPDTVGGPTRTNLVEVASEFHKEDQAEPDEDVDASQQPNANSTENVLALPTFRVQHAHNARFVRPIPIVEPAPMLPQLKVKSSRRSPYSRVMLRMPLKSAGSRSWNAHKNRREEGTRNEDREATGKRRRENESNEEDGTTRSVKKRKAKVGCNPCSNKKLKKLRENTIVFAAEESRKRRQKAVYGLTTERVPVVNRKSPSRKGRRVSESSHSLSADSNDDDEEFVQSRIRLRRKITQKTTCKGHQKSDDSDENSVSVSSSVSTISSSDEEGQSYANLARASTVNENETEDIPTSELNIRPDYEHGPVRNSAPDLSGIVKSDPVEQVRKTHRKTVKSEHINNEKRISSEILELIHAFDNEDVVKQAESTYSVLQNWNLRKEETAVTQNTVSAIQASLDRAIRYKSKHWFLVEKSLHCLNPVALRKAGAVITKLGPGCRPHMLPDILRRECARPNLQVEHVYLTYIQNGLNSNDFIRAVQKPDYTNARHKLDLKTASNLKHSKPMKDLKTNLEGVVRSLVDTLGVKKVVIMFVKTDVPSYVADGVIKIMAHTMRKSRYLQEHVFWADYRAVEEKVPTKGEQFKLSEFMQEVLYEYGDDIK